MTLDNAGNTLSTARKLNLTSTTQTVTDFVGASDLNDFYSFSLSGSSSLKLNLGGLTANADVQIVQDRNGNGIFDASSEVITGSYLIGTASESITTNLGAGNYFIRVFPGTGANTNYNLGVSAASFSDRVLELTNAERAKVGLSALKLNSQLNQAAQSHTQEMALRDYVSHTGANGSQFSDRISATGYKFSAAAENIAAGYVTPEDVVQGWMNSSGHKANILNANYKDIGIGHYYLANDTGSTNYYNYWTQNFGVSTQQPINIAPTALEFGLEKTVYNNTETLRITNGSVFDANGATDINRVDFRIKRADGTFVDTADISSVTPSASNSRWGQFNYGLNLAGLNLTSGNYSLWAVAYDKAGSVSNVVEQKFSLTVPNIAPNSLQFGLEKTTYNNTETLRITNGWVFDANGATDINRVDFKIKRADGSFLDTADIFSTTSATWDNRWGQFNYSLNLTGLNLGTGNYSLWAVAYDKAGAVSNVVERQFNFTSLNIAPNSLQFGLEKTAYNNTETLRITNGLVYDGNGAIDINRVDFRIKRADGTFLDTADIFSFTPNTSENRWGQFNYGLNLAGLNLGAGNHSLWAVAYDKAGAVSNFVERQFNFTGNIAPSSLQFGLEKTTYNNTETLRITNGWVFDANGAIDINRVDFKIKRADGSFLDTADIFSFTPHTSENRLGQFNYSLNLAGLNLASGNHSLWAVAYDKAGAVSNFVERQFNFTGNIAPNSLQFGLEKTAYNNTETLRITNGWVYDGNGAIDINRVDFKIKRADGSFLDTADVFATTPNTSDNRWGQFNYGLNLAGLNLASGNYSLWAQAYDKAGFVSNVVEQKFSFAVGSTYNSTSGYGLINAAAAVAKAIGQNTFVDVPNLGGNDWGADLVKAPEVWARGYTGKGVVVAVLDTGVDYNHADLKGNIWTNSREIAGNGRDDDGNGFIDDVYGWNFNDKNNNTLDTRGHGTHVAGTIAGVRNNFGVTGIAYDAKIMSVRVLGNGGGTGGSVAQGIYYAVDNGANVINMSLGSGDSPASEISEALKYASSKGVIVVMSAGNEGSTLPGFPARYADKWGIAVGAVDRNNNMASFSNRAGLNPLAYVTAPGVSIYSTIPGNGYGFMNGTSMAAPHVAGVVALMLSASPKLSDSRVREIVTQSAFNGQNSAFVGNNGLSTSAVNARTSGTYSVNQSIFDSITPKLANLKTNSKGAYSFKEGNIFTNSTSWLQSQSFYQKIQSESLTNSQTILELDEKRLLK